MSLFKYKSEKKLKKPKDNRADLLKSSVLENGVIAMENDIVLTQNEKSYAIYQIEFLESNGIDIHIDDENEEKVNALVKALEHDFKIIDIPVQKNNLLNNIEDMLLILEKNEVSEKRFQKIKERIEVMRFYNNEKYLTTFFFISQNDIEIFEKLAPDVFYIKRLNEMECMGLLKRLNNEF